MRTLRESKAETSHLAAADVVVVLRWLRKNAKELAMVMSKFEFPNLWKTSVPSPDSLFCSLTFGTGTWRSSVGGQRSRRRRGQRHPVGGFTSSHRFAVGISILTRRKDILAAGMVRFVLGILTWT
jgi:hypothetical protein